MFTNKMKSLIHVYGKDIYIIQIFTYLGEVIHTSGNQLMDFPGSRNMPSLDEE